MVYFPLEDMLPKAGGNSYKLISLAAERALELSNGAAKLVEAPAIEKLTTTAMREILEGKVVLKSVSDKFIPTNT
jgi:DNA-directed RNA polymerase omega subunit